MSDAVSEIRQQKSLLEEFRTTAENLQYDLKQKSETLEEICQKITYNDEEVRLVIDAEAVSQTEEEMHVIERMQIRRRSERVRGRKVA